VSLTGWADSTPYFRASRGLCLPVTAFSKLDNVSFKILILQDIDGEQAPLILPRKKYVKMDAFCGKALKSIHFYVHFPFPRMFFCRGEGLGCPNRPPAGIGS
jgi:hypothetical protein